MLRIYYVLIVAIFTAVAQCQTVTLLNSSSYLAYEGLVIQPEGAVSLNLRTYQLNATVLYIQGVNDTFLLVHLLNGKMSITVYSGDDLKSASLPNPVNTNEWLKVRVVFTAGAVQLTGNGGMESLNINGQLNIMSPIFIGGTPDTPPFSITSSLVLDSPHLVGCVRRVQLSNGTTETESAQVAGSNDLVLGSCTTACSRLDCNPDRSSEGACIEYYTHGICDCRAVFDSEGPLCDGKVNDVAIMYYVILSIRGTRCFITEWSQL